MLQAETRPSPNQRKSMRRSAGGESRPDPKVSRRRRLEDGYLQLINKDPTKQYVWAHKTEICGRPHYEAVGWKVCITEEGGVRSALKPAQPCGEEITSLDTVLMEIPKDEFEEIQAEGEFGATGQRYMDVLQRRIFKPDGRARRLRELEQALAAEDADDLGGFIDDAESGAEKGRY